MKRAVILHGTQGSPDGNWFRWLETRLRSKGLEVWLPQLPHAEQPSLSEWLGFVHDNCPFPIDDQTLLIGHSSGAALALALAASSESEIGAVAAVSPFVPMKYTYVGSEWDANASLFDLEFDWQRVKSHVVKLLLVCSDNDPYIPTDVFDYIAKQSGAEQVVVTGQGHFNLEASSDFTEFPLLLRLLMERGLVSQNLVQVVDEDDKPIGVATKRELHEKGLRHRVSRLILEDQQGNILLQRRRDNDGRIWEGCWDTSAAGHVDEGETHYEAIVRETEEELGLQGIALDEAAYYKTNGEYRGRLLNRWNRLYTGVIPHDTPIHLQANEVAETRWFTPDELMGLVETDPDRISDGLKEAYGILYKIND